LLTSLLLLFLSLKRFVHSLNVNNTQKHNTSYHHYHIVVLNGRTVSRLEQTSLSWKSRC